MIETAAPYLSLIVPIYNEGERLVQSLAEIHAFLDAQPYRSELILVDDHSRPETERIALDHVTARPEVRLLRNERNSGKGASVKRGMLTATGAHRVYTDADLAYPAEEIAKILGDLARGADVAVACRVLRASRYLVSPSFLGYLFTRHVMSRALNRVIRLALVPGVLDTQAGLKGFSARAAELVFPRVSISRFGFDVEALFIAHKHHLSIAQTAVRFRYDEEPTTVRFLHDGLRMARDLSRIRINDVRGKYD